MDAGGFILLEEMILVCWSLSFIDEENSSSDIIESIDGMFLFWFSPDESIKMLCCLIFLFLKQNSPHAKKKDKWIFCFGQMEDI